MHALTKSDPELENYTDIIKPYVGGYDAMNVPYWILVEDQQVVGIVVVGEEPLKLIEPIGSTVSVVLIVDYEQPADVMDAFVLNALRIAEEQKALYSFIDMSEEHKIPIASFLNNGYEEIVHSLKMTCKLDGDYSQELSLRFERVEREEVTIFLNTLKEFMKGSQDAMLDILFNNLGKLPDAFLDHWFKNEMLFYVYEEYELVGVLDISPNDSDGIANFGVSSKYRGKGYGRQLMLYGMNLLKEQGNENAGLRVHVNNKIAQQLYESLGFKQEASRRALIWRKK